MKLNEIHRFTVSRQIVAETDRALRTAGDDGYECFGLWTGGFVNSTFAVEHLYVPSQEAYRGEDGVCVQVGADELHALNRWLYDEHQTLAIQIHTHPHEAYHSETDDTYPIVTTLGGVSIVVADFARPGLLASSTAYYRLEPRGWVAVHRAPANPLLEVS